MAILVSGGHVLNRSYTALERADILIESDRISAVGSVLEIWICRRRYVHGTSHALGLDVVLAAPSSAPCLDTEPVVRWLSVRPDSTTVPVHFNAHM